MIEYIISKSTTLREALAVIEKGGRGIAILVDDHQKILRTVTDGDIRRLLLDHKTLEDSISILPDRQPATAPVGVSRVEALEIMDERQVDHLPVVDDQGHVVNVLDRRTISKRIYLSSPHMGEFEKEYVEEAFRSNWIAPVGPNVTHFERELASKVGTKAAAALSSGSAALHLAMRVLDVNSGDRVFCSTLTFVASANPIVYQGAEPVFIDSEPGSWNMSPAALERALEWAKSDGKLPKAIIVVNLYGQSADMDRLLEIADAYNIPIVEDAAESLGATYKGKPSGSFGKIGIFSFNGNKIITTSGGGMLVSDDEEIVERVRFLSTQAREPAVHYEHKEVGYNYRMSNILAGVGRGQLRVLDDRVYARRKLFSDYKDALSDIEGISWMPEPEWSFSNRWLSVCTMNDALLGDDYNNLITVLNKDMIETRPVWKPMHRQPLFKDSRYFAHGNESVSDQLYSSGICLPSGSNMSSDEFGHVVDALRRYLLR